MSATAKRHGAIVTRPQALSALALAVSTLLGHSLAQAATEEELKAVKLYGNVTIAQDSSSDWGPWTAFEPPAAGRDVNVLNAFSKPELYRPLAQATQTVPEPLGLSCAGGSICGFGAFTNYTFEYTNDIFIGNDIANPAGYGNDMQDIHPVIMVGTVIKPGSGQDSLPAIVPDSLSIASQPLTTGDFLFANSGELTLYTGEGIGYYREVDTNTHYESYDLWTNGYAGDANPQDTQLVAVNSYQTIEDYITGTGEASNTETTQGLSQQMWGVMGITTPDVDMAALRASKAIVTYTGTDYYGGKVNIIANIGESTWGGSWNDGKDGSVYTYKAASGATILQGQVGFYVPEGKGIISGVNFSSTNIATYDADTTAISGVVKGAFYGPNAAAVGGVADITKTRPVVAVPEASAGAVRAVSEASTPGYGTGRYVAPFIAVRPELRNNDK
jgi:hypothetical protein